MAKEKMTSMQRVTTTLEHREPDRVPLFLPLTMHGARELGLSIKEYFSRADYVVEGQVRMQEKYGHDCYYGFFYGPAEVEAFGGEVIFVDDGPPNSGEPLISDFADLHKIVVPDISTVPVLQEVLKTIRMLHQKAAGNIPVMGVVVSPFSLPVMQIGFENYLDLIFNRRELFWKLMQLNETFAVEWANAQFAAGATAVAYFDPFASPTIIPRDLYLETGWEIAKRTIAKLNGPTATHLASGRTMAVIDDLAQTGTGGVGVGSSEQLWQVKRACRGKLAVIGNLNGLEMHRWSRDEIFCRVREAISGAAPDGGFILSDSHGEIPWRVTDEQLRAISDAVREYGNYPIK